MDDPADERTVPAIAAPPHAVTEHDDGGRTGGFVGESEVAAGGGPLADYLEEISADLHASQGLRQVFVVAQAVLFEARGGDAGEGFRLLAPIAKIRVGDGTELAGVATGLTKVARAHVDDAVVAVEGEAFEEHGVGECEDDGVGADAEGEGEENYGGVTRTFR